MQQWIQGIIDSETPPDDIRAFHFGLFETSEGFTVYLTGSSVYDATDDDWSCREDFIPTDKYYALSGSAYQGSWESVLATVEAELQAWSDSEAFRNSFFADAEAITTGFDDGDLIRIR